jgi:S-formylglutathione hydrolase FrmB
MRKLKHGALAAALALLAVAGSAGAAQASQLVELTIPGKAGEIPQSAITYPGPPRANVLLPDGYDPSRKYPLLLLLHGLNDSYSSWAVPGLGDVSEVAKGLNAIIVMPEGAAGWYTDWWNDGQRGGPSWETYILNRVLPTVRRTYKIRAQRRYHAIVGVSMGGLGATYLGGRLPGYFGSVGSLSGFVDTQLIPGLDVAMAAVSNAAPLAVAGPEDGFYANGHNPTKLVANLAQSRLFVTTGTGVPDDRGVASPADIVSGGAQEIGVIRPMTEAYLDALKNAGIEPTFVDDAGVHQWLYFRDELRKAIAWGLFKPVAEAPRKWTNDTVATHGQLWDLGYRFDAPPDGVVHFARDGRHLTVSGSGGNVTLTTKRGCVVHVALPADLTVPKGMQCAA